MADIRQFPVRQKAVDAAALADELRAIEDAEAVIVLVRRKNGDPQIIIASQAENAIVLSHVLQSFVLTQLGYNFET